MGMKLSSLIIVLLIVLLLFGTGRLRNIGGDLANALKNFRKGLKDDNKSDET